MNEYELETLKEFPIHPIHPLKSLISFRNDDEVFFSPTNK